MWSAKACIYINISTDLAHSCFSVWTCVAGYLPAMLLSVCSVGMIFLCRSVKSEHMSCCVVVRRFVSWLEWGCVRVCVCAFLGSAGWVQQCYVFLQSQCVAAMQSDTHSSDQYKGSAWERGGLSFRGGRGACLIWAEFYSSQYIHWSGTHISVC